MRTRKFKFTPAPFGRQILCHMTLGFRIHLWIYGFIIYYANYADHIYMYIYFYSTSDPPPPCGISFKIILYAVN